MMNALHIRDELISRLSDLSDEQAAALLEFLKVIHPDESAVLHGYNEAHDPLLNGELSFSGAPDLAERSEDILHAEWGTRRDIDEQNT